MIEVRKIYEYALQREREGKRFFEENAARLSHAAATGAFKKLAAEEQRHIEFIQWQIEALDEGRKPVMMTDLELENAGFFEARKSSEVIDQTVLEAMVPDLPVLRMAYLIERDFAEFYETYAHKVDGDAQQVLSMLANWERGHERFFKEMHDRAFDEYAGMPWGG